MRTHRLLAAAGGLSLFAAVAGAVNLGLRPAEIAQGYGIEHFSRVEKLQFTFEVEREGQILVSRRWSWEPRTQKVGYSGKDASGQPVEANYVRTPELMSAGAAPTPVPTAAPPGGTPAPAATPADPLAALDRSFINDTYWLLFPFHMVWDRNVSITRDGLQPMQHWVGEAHRLTVRYLGDAGPTPRDVYEVYVGPDGRLVGWVFYKGGAAEGRPMSWAQHAELGPMVVALEHKSPDGKFAVRMKDVSVVIDGETHQAKPAPDP